MLLSASIVGCLEFSQAVQARARGRRRSGMVGAWFCLSAAASWTLAGSLSHRLVVVALLVAPARRTVSGLDRDRRGDDFWSAAPGKDVS
jgi:hypothetical protein